MIIHPHRSILGPIPDNWETIPLRRCLAVSAAGDWGDEHGEVTLSVLRSTNFTDSRELDLRDVALRGFSQKDAEKFTLLAGDILVERSGGGPAQPVGRVVTLDRDLPGSGFSNFVQMLRVDREVMNPDYVAWCLYRLHQCGIIERLQHQTTQMRNLDFRDYVRVHLPRPGPREQQSIADIIYLIDDSIRAAQTEREKAERVKTALLQELFRRGLPGRHQRFIQTKIGEIPEEWSAPKLGSFADVEAGVALNQDRAPRSNAYQYLTVVNVQRGIVTIDEPRFLELWESEVPRKLLREGDIVVVEGHANSGEIGRAAMIGPEQDGFTYQNHLFRLRLTGETIRRDFLLYALNSEYARRHWNAVCNTSSGLNTINRRQLRRLLIPQPKPDEQERIVELMALSEAAISSVSRKVAALERLKRSLLQNLLTGRIRLREAATAA